MLCTPDGFVPWSQDKLARELFVHCASHVINSDLPAPLLDADWAIGSAIKTVYRGKLANQAIILKVWRGLNMTSSFRERFTKQLSIELDDWKRVQHHPHVVPFLGVMLGFDLLPALVVPSYKNGNINRYLAAKPDANILHLLGGVAEGLAYMHNLQPPVVHGGIRGANILISDTGAAQLSDIAITTLPYSPDLTMTGSELLGTRWMAPEVLDPNSSVDVSEDGDNIFFQTYNTPKSDVYSFGMTVLEVYSQKVPFSHRRSHAGAIADVVQGLRPPRPMDCVMLTDGIWMLIEACWQHDPAERWGADVVWSWVQRMQIPGFEVLG